MKSLKLKQVISLTIITCLMSMSIMVNAGTEKLIVKGKTGSTNINDGFIRESYVCNGAATSAFNTDTMLNVGNDGTDNGTFSTYLRVVYYNTITDVSSIKSATLRLCVAEATDGAKINFYPTHNAFDESITFNNTPENGHQGTIANAPIISTASIDSSSIDKWIEVDVTEYIKTFETMVKPYITAGSPGFPAKNASFRVSSFDVENGSLVKFYSTRHNKGVSKGPQLIIVHENESISPTVETSPLKLMRTANTVSLLVSYKNTKLEDVNAKAIIAYYSKYDINGNANLMKVDYADYTLLSGYTTVNEKAISSNIPEGTAIIKGFLWDNLSKATPLAKFAVGNPNAPIPDPFTVYPSDFTFVGTDSGYAFGNTNNQVRTSQSGASGPKQDFYVLSPGANASNKYVEFTFEAPDAGLYELNISTKTDVSRGIYDVKINNIFVGSLDGYASTATFVDKLITNNVNLVKGTNTIRFTGNGRNPLSTNNSYMLVVDSLKFIPGDQL